ncbi:nickel pincer cofactor biosynthesis protein LarC [Synechococcales cyanobacterium C]|uniref:Putative nickel insertion protein n=1 Tax=Petrachloros mirabilis ULC683 TaxID=2781853 RepID=A0A8K1ZYX7_9CYAN|nr:nickel pincer cofactor biosynthesis protein LarC [Petrachloros mirabilis]NCJ07724.1 nickel pincer cofactor biosynthesis protein LarC [Petrachloros mirabilis ULC683]
MTNVAYLECATGIAGNMCLGALLDGGVPLAYLQTQLARLKLVEAYDLQVTTVKQGGQQATQVTVEINAPNAIAHRHLPEIEALLGRSDLPASVLANSLAVFKTLAIAEGAVHGVPPESVHFHEVGATDAIIDIVGTCLGLDWLGVEYLVCSPMPTGGGTVRAAHGQLPVPVPAVLKLWEQRQVPVYDNGIARELVTPTGAAIALTLADSFGPPPAMTLERVGLGAGTHVLPLPNLLRLWLGKATASALESPFEANLEVITVLETQLDDLTPQAIGYAYDALFAAGALDVFTQAIGMKKSRPGLLLTVICPPNKVSACETVLFRETSTLGIRRTQQQRHALRREHRVVETPWGSVGIKLAWHKNTLVNVNPEYEDCAQLAQQHQRTWQEIQHLALTAWYQQQSAVCSDIRAAHPQT